jgi:hypothetical protein
MKFLKKRTRPDTLTTERRPSAQTLGRTIYVVFLIFFLIFVLNYFWGDYFVFRSDGLVMRDQSTVAAPYIVQVDTVYVSEGQLVEKGQPLVKLLSVEILGHLADLSSKRATLIAQEADYKIRAESLKMLLPLSERYDARAAATVTEFDKVAGQKLIPSVQYEQAQRLQFDARRERARLTAENTVLRDEMKALDAALGEADTMFRDLQAVYSGGMRRAVVSGTVGPTVPSQGDVYRPGDPLMTVYFGEPYILLYLPRRYLFSVYAGMELRVWDGQHSTPGVIKEILPVTNSLPKEFQNAFRPADHNQLAKIQLKLTGPLPFPLLQKVRVSLPYPRFCGVPCRWLLGNPWD